MEAPEGLGAFGGDYYVALAFGAFVVAVFAWEQFNRPSHEASRELNRLIELLTPSRMRRQTVYRRAYIFYAGILLLFYLLFCVYGLILGPLLGVKIAGYEEAQIGASALPAPVDDVAAPTSGFDQAAIDALPQQLSSNTESVSDLDRYQSDPRVPLFISMIIVGLAPSAPWLFKAEKKLRFVAHQLSGIPTRLISGAAKLRDTPLHLGTGPEGMLIPSKDWKRLQHYMAKAEVDDPDALRDDLEKIVAFRSWVLQQKLPLANFAMRDSLKEIEADIRKAVERLMFTLDTLSDFEGMSAERAEAGDRERLRAAWEAAARDADQVSADISVLSMLYVEHGVLPTEETAASLGWGADPGPGASDAMKQKALAEQKLTLHLTAAARYIDHENFPVTIWLRAAATVVVVSFLFGIVVNLDSVTDGQSLAASRFTLGLTVALQSALTYALALLAAISWQRTGWHNLFENNWARWTPQVFGLAFVSGSAALFCLIGLNVLSAIFAVGVEPVLAKPVGVILGAVAFEGPRALLGLLLAFFVVIIIDAWRSDTARGRRWLAWLPWLTAASMLLAGIAIRRWSSLASLEPGDDSAGFRSLLDWFGSQPAWLMGTGEAPGSQVWTQALSAGALACLVGAAVAFFVKATLTHQFARVKVGGAGSEKPRQDDATAAPQPAE